MSSWSWHGDMLHRCPAGTMTPCGFPASTDATTRLYGWSSVQSRPSVFPAQAGPSCPFQTLRRSARWSGEGSNGRSRASGDVPRAVAKIVFQPIFGRDPRLAAVVCAHRTSPLSAPLSCRSTGEERISPRVAGSVGAATVRVRGSSTAPRKPGSARPDRRRHRCSAHPERPAGTGRGR